MAVFQTAPRTEIQKTLLSKEVETVLENKCTRGCKKEQSAQAREEAEKTRREASKTQRKMGKEREQQNEKEGDGVPWCGVVRKPPK